MSLSKNRRQAQKPLMMDSCVLIDIISARPDLLVLIAINVAPVYAIGAVVDEIDGIEETELAELGVVIVESEIEDAYNIEKLGKLSVPDQLCMLAARRLNCVCVTNDKCLRKACERISVDCMWGLQPLLLLKTKGFLSFKEAREVVHRIRKQNPKHITEKIVNQFLEKMKRPNR